MDESGQQFLRAADQVTLIIQDLAFGGEGVGKTGEFVVFVPFVDIGEEVLVEITEVKKRFARSKLLKVLRSSPHRVQPLCPYFGDCGGCQYQHIDYSRQLAHKEHQIRSLFQRVGGFSKPPVQPVVPSPAPYGYRNRIMIRTQWDKYKRGLNIGFVRADSGLVVDVEECRIAEPAINEQLRRVRLSPPPKGGLKVVLRIPPEGWELPPDSFFQNNFFLLPRMVETVGEMLSSAGNRHLVDVYCGVGFFALELAAAVDSFVGVEYDALAIKAARKNAIHRRAFNGEFLAGAAEDLLPTILEKFDPKRTTLILDPPRKGCLPQTIQLLRNTRPSQIIYISCHPATMARDLNVLCRDGVYQLSQVVPLDMFPQTQHVECIADLRAI